MNNQPRLKCLHCGNEYAAAGDPMAEERVCPVCHSNSVRLLRSPQSEGFHSLRDGHDE